MNRSATPRGIGSYAVLVLLAAATLVPLLSLLLASFQPSGSAVSGLAWPDDVTFDNYRSAWSAAGFGNLLGNSLIVAGLVVPATLMAATLAGYALGTMRLPGSEALFVFFVSGLTIPVELVVIPLYYDLRAFDLTNTLWAVVLVEIGLFMPFGIFWMRTHFRSMPLELIEAARVDGASSLRILVSILLPLSRPALTTLAALVFMWSWNQFLLVLILIQDTELRTAPAGLGFFVGQYKTDIPVLAAGTVIVIVPVLTVYLIFQRHFINGLVQGALKG
jgi:ABC-type glycerol-3-phosphate transport system permease component